MPAYRDRAAMAYHICRRSSKLAVIAGLMGEDLQHKWTEGDQSFATGLRQHGSLRFQCLFWGLNVRRIRAKRKQKERGESGGGL